MAVKGKCNCGKKATTEWLVTQKKKKRERYGTCWTLKFCESCKPLYKQEGLQQIDGPTVHQSTKRSGKPGYKYTSMI